MADGYISNKGNLRIHLSEIDRQHLMKLASYIERPWLLDMSKNMVALDAGDKINGLALKEFLGITIKKTFNPPKLDFLTNSVMRLAFFMGFSDGDGSIHFDHNDSFKSLRIIIHANWFETMQEFCGLLSSEHPLKFTVNNTNARGNTSVYMGTKAAHRYMVDFAEQHHLPILTRKWYPKLKEEIA